MKNQNNKIRFIKVWTILAILFFGVADLMDAKSYEVRKKAGEYDVHVKLEKNPPILGDNPIEIEIKDGVEKQVKDAKVLINYYMPPMPRMAPMNYTIDTKVEGGRYVAKMRFIMTGPWIIVIKIKRGEKTSTAKLNVDVQ
jgi:YtkA-like